MSSQSSVEDLPTPGQAPSTPQNVDVEPLVRRQLSRQASPNTSMMVAPPSSSMTPPPSSQNPHARTATMITSRLSRTPDAAMNLSSPPPTEIKGTRKEASINSLTKPTTEQIANASPGALRQMVEAALAHNAKLDAENAKLDIIAREARMSAAHYKLQHNLLTIESEEAGKQHEVEQDMTLREVDLLQARVQDAQDPPELEHYRRRCKALEGELRKAQDNLRKAKRIIIAKDDDIIDLEINVKQLRERIRINRSHINEMRSPGGIYHNPSLQQSPATPQYYRSTPKHTPMTNRSVRQGRDESQEPFAALLLADAVLREGNNSAPSTPIVDRRPAHRTPNRHSRGVQSLSSLPTTPGSARQKSSHSTLLPSAQFSAQAEARVATTLSGGLQQPRERRRKSRDSTISASDTEEIERAAAGGYREESQEVTESQASQSATEMLRRDPRESFEVAASRTSTPTPGVAKSFHQAKIFGTVTKPVVEKRKRGNEEYDYAAAKKPRAQAAVGLGIDRAF
jgi:hypothetical protein